MARTKRPSTWKICPPIPENVWEGFDLADDEPEQPWQCEQFEQQIELQRVTERERRLARYEPKDSRRRVHDDFRGCVMNAPW